MKKKERTEEREGREFKVITLPSDLRLQPGQVKKRQLFQALSSREKQAFFREARKKAAKKRRRKKK